MEADSDDDWDKPKEVKKDEKEVKKEKSASSDDDNWDLDDKDLGLQDNVKKPEPAKVEVKTEPEVKKAAIPAKEEKKPDEAPK